MNANPGETGSPSRQLADAIDRLAGLIDRIPECQGYQCAPETELELRAAAALMQRAELYLRCAAAREAPRLEAIEAEFQARGELPPWSHNTHRLVEDAD
ncbi:MAG TPA: hypothetical protein VMT66_18275 [Steroidobacteraceae bacterium]|nr:hypothetical protein [Steroidobacteraceae bacterium]